MRPARTGAPEIDARASTLHRDVDAPTEVAVPQPVDDNAELSRFEIKDHGRVVGIADYRVEGDRVVLPHTEVDPALRGSGLGAELIRAALDAIRDSGRGVVPQCSYVAHFIAEHPDYQDLVAP
jgi:predicted GNAT family acetyltransferase